MEAQQGMIQRWLHILSQFTFTVKHRPGVRHANADSLSGAPHIHANTSNIPQLTDDDDDDYSVQRIALPNDVVLPPPRTELNNLFLQFLKQHQEMDLDILFLLPLIHKHRALPKHILQTLSPTGNEYASLLDSLTLDQHKINRLKLDSSTNSLRQKWQVILLPFLLIKGIIIKTHEML